MSSPSEQLVSHLTDSLSENLEIQLAAQQILSEGLTSAAPKAIEHELLKSKQTPQTGVRGFLRKKRNPLFLAILFLLALALLLPTFLKNYRLKNMMMSSGWSIGIGNEKEYARSHLSKAEQDLVFGEEDKYRAHIKNNAKDPSAFALRLLSSQRANPKFFDSAKSIDPNNSFFPLLQAGKQLDASMEKNRSYRKRTTPKGTPHKVITDPELFAQGFKQLEEALDLPHHQNYRNKNRSSKLATLPPETDILSRFTRFSVKANQYYDPSLLYFIEAISIKAEDFQKSNNSSSLQALFSLSLKLSQHYNNEPSDFIAELVYSAYLKRISEIFSRSEVKRLLSEIQRTQLQEIVEESQFQSQIKKTTASSDFYEQHGQEAGLLTLFTSPPAFRFSSLVSPLSKQEIEPERRYWQALLEHFFCFGISAILFLASILLLNSGKKKNSLNQISLQLERFTPTHHLICFSFLVAGFSFFIHWFWTRATPIGVLDKAWFSTPSQPHTHAHHLLILGILTFTSAITFGRFLAFRRLARIQLCSPLSPLFWWPIPFLIICYPLTALIQFDFTFPFSEHLPSLLLFLITSWFLWFLFRLLTASTPTRLAEKLATRYASTLLTAPIFCSLIAIPLLEQAELHWIRHDHYNSTNLHPHGYNRLEHDVSLALFKRHQSLLQKLAELDSASTP